MNIYIHELTHLILSLLVGLIIWKKWYTHLTLVCNPKGCQSSLRWIYPEQIHLRMVYKHIGVFIAAFIGGFFIDLDHLFDYFLAFGTKFNLTYFLKGYQFLKTDKIYIFLHAWEWVFIAFFIFLILHFITKDKKAQLLSFCMFAFSFSLFLHLFVDVTTNNMQAKSYFLIYRINNNFQLKTMVTSDHYQKHLEQKKQVKFNY